MLVALEAMGEIKAGKKPYKLQLVEWSWWKTN